MWHAAAVKVKNSKQEAKKSVFIGLWVDRDLADNIGWEAGEHDRSISAEIRFIIKKHLKHLYKP